MKVNMTDQNGKDKILYVYTDGGCRGNHKKENIGGWGFYLKHGDKELREGGSKRNTTNNEMELTACIEALKRIKNKSLKTIVIVDSKYVLKGITEWIPNWIRRGWRTSSGTQVKNKELWVELFALKAQFKNIRFELCKGHSGNDGNEIADRLCNEAMDELENSLKNE